MKESNLYEFRLFPSTKKEYRREHWCANDAEARAEARGMIYAMYFEYKHPRIEVYRNGKLIQRIS